MERKRVTRKALQGMIRDILVHEKASTQQAVQKHLADKGCIITQSSVSRLLHSIGAVKSKDTAGKTVYQMPIEPFPPSPNNPLYSLIVNISKNETTIVIHTSPGAASLVARVIDYNKIDFGILGTIAGDDIIFVAPASIQHINDTYEKIKKSIS